MHINRHTPRSLIYGPQSHGGIELPNIYNLQGYLQTKLILQITRLELPIAKLLQICYDNLQMEFGSEGIIFESELPITNYITPTWLSNWWEYLTRNKLRYLRPKPWNIPKQREGDQIIHRDEVD